MTDNKKTYRDPLQILVEHVGKPLPAGCDRWGMKTVGPDLRTRGGFQWPLPGGTVEDTSNLEQNNDSPCPLREGDGLCVALTYEGMKSGGRPAHGVQLVAFSSSDVLGEDRHKVRVGGPVRVVGMVDGEQFARADLTRADLTRANLTRANLTGANLTRANLTEANLYGANLTRANLTRARNVILQDGWTLTESGIAKLAETATS